MPRKTWKGKQLFKTDALTMPMPKYNNRLLGGAEVFVGRYY